MLSRAASTHEHRRAAESEKTAQQEIGGTCTLFRIKRKTLVDGRGEILLAGVVTPVLIVVGADHPDGALGVALNAA